MPGRLQCFQRAETGGEKPLSRLPPGCPVSSHRAAGAEAQFGECCSVLNSLRGLSQPLLLVFESGVAFGPHSQGVRSPHADLHLAGIVRQSLLGRMGFSLLPLVIAAECPGCSTRRGKPNSGPHVPTTFPLDDSDLGGGGKQGLPHTFWE